MSDNNTPRITTSAVPLTTVIFGIFLTLKLTGIGAVANWSWWWVTSPLWIPWLVIFGIAVIFFVIWGIVRLFESDQSKKNRKARSSLKNLR